MEAKNPTNISVGNKLLLDFLISSNQLMIQGFKMGQPIPYLEAKIS